MVKVDIEGAELQMLEGASETLAQKKVAVWMLEANDACKKFCYERTDMYNLLKEHGYTLYTYDACTNALECIVDGKTYQNIFAVLNPSAVLKRLQTESLR